MAKNWTEFCYAKNQNSSNDIKVYYRGKLGSLAETISLKGYSKLFSLKKELISKNALTKKNSPLLPVFAWNPPPYFVLSIDGFPDLILYYNYST